MSFSFCSRYEPFPLDLLAFSQNDYFEAEFTMTVLSYNEFYYETHSVAVWFARITPRFGARVAWPPTYLPTGTYLPQHPGPGRRPQTYLPTF